MKTGGADAAHAPSQRRTGEPPVACATNIERPHDLITLWL